MINIKTIRRRNTLKMQRESQKEKTGRKQAGNQASTETSKTTIEFEKISWKLIKQIIKEKTK